MADEIRNGDSKVRVVRLLGHRDDAGAWEIRDFLKRSVVGFQWIELSTEEDCRRELGLSDLMNVNLPVVELPDGTRLFGPTLWDVADRLGFVTKPKLRQYDVSIYGAGPAGLSAAVYLYAASEGLSTVLIERSAVGGQAGTTSMIENYMGFPQGISAADLAERARQQAVKFGVEILMMREGVKSTFHDDRIWTDLADGGTMVARANVCATGVAWSHLNLPNEDKLLGRGLYYGAGASEAPLCGGEDVYVVGGRNSAGQAVMHLAKHAKSVTMLMRDKALAASTSQYLSDRILGAANVQVRCDVEVTGLDGGQALERIRIGSRTTKEANWAATPRLFVAIGGVPNTDWAADTAIVRDPGGYLVAGPDLLINGKAPASWPLERAPYYLETAVPGSFAAGDVRHRSIKRVATAAGEGAMAIAFVHRYLEETA
jgi:thioredoxin reductase (NADPH)